jgi:hypothetical protein
MIGRADFQATLMSTHEYIVFIVFAWWVVATIRDYVDARKQVRLDAVLADRKYESKMRFKSEWRMHEGAEAIFREGNRIFDLVRVHSIDADGRSVDIYLDRIPWPGLPFYLTRGSEVPDSFDIGAHWDHFAIGRNYWQASGYGHWTLIFDPETIQAFKTLALEFQSATEMERRNCIREYLAKWLHTRQYQLPDTTTTPNF